MNIKITTNAIYSKTFYVWKKNIGTLKTFQNNLKKSTEVHEIKLFK